MPAEELARYMEDPRFEGAMRRFAKEDDKHDIPGQVAPSPDGTTVHYDRNTPAEERPFLKVRAAVDWVLTTVFGLPHAQAQRLAVEAEQHARTAAKDIPRGPTSRGAPPESRPDKKAGRVPGANPGGGANEGKGNPMNGNDERFPGLARMAKAPTTRAAQRMAGPADPNARSIAMAGGPTGGYAMRNPRVVGPRAPKPVLAKPPASPMHTEGFAPSTRAGTPPGRTGAMPRRQSQGAIPGGGDNAGITPKLSAGDMRSHALAIGGAHHVYAAGHIDKATRDQIIEKSRRTLADRRAERAKAKPPDITKGTPFGSLAPER